MVQKTKTQQEALSGSPQPNFTAFTPAPIKSKREPTTSDLGYPIGQVWVNTVAGHYWVLIRTGSGIAVWQNLGPSGGGLATLTGDIGGAVSAVANNINLLGSPDISFRNGGAGTMTATDLVKITPYVVAASDAPYTSIQAAVNAASAAGGGVVAIRPGTYVQNVNMLPNVSICGFSGINIHPITIIQGTVTANYVGNATLYNIAIQENVGTPLVVSGAGIMTLAVENCTVISTNSTAFSINNSNVQVQFLNSLCIQNGAFGHLNVANGQMISLYCIYGDPNSLALSSTMSGGLIYFIGGLLNLGIQSTGGLCLINGAIIQPKNVIPIDCQGAGAIFVFSSTMLAPNGLAGVNCQGFAVSLNYCTVDAGPPFAVTGNGTFNYDLISFDNNDQLDPALGTVARSVRPFATSAPNNVTAVRGLSSYNSDDFTVDIQGFVTLGTGKQTVNTIGAVTQTVLTIPVPVFSCMQVSVEVAGFESTTPAGAVISIIGGAQKGGAGTAALVGVPTIVTKLDAALAAASVSMVIDGAGDNILIRVTGVVGLTINWAAKSFNTTAP